MLDNSMQRAYNQSMHMHAPFLAEYPDFTAFFITIFLSVILSYGVQESTRFNNVFTVLNLVVVCFVMVVGFSQANPQNWSKSPRDEKDKGGFFPFGFSGTLSGAATCFYGFVGFDAIATTGEETKNPQKSIPIAIIVSLAFICVSYIGISSALTLMLPYYLQDSAAPLPHAFHEVGLSWAGWVVSIGAMFGLSTSLLGAMFPLPRVLYAMASDGLIPRPLATVHKRFQTPLLATLLAGFGAAVMALLFDLAQLVDMMSIGTLMAYTMVGICVLILHYQDESAQAPEAAGPSYSPLSTADDTNEDSDEDLFSPEELGSAPGSPRYSWSSYFRQLLNLDGLTTPSPLSAKVARHNIILFSVLSIPWSVLVNCDQTAWTQFCIVTVTATMLLCIVIIYRQPQSLSHTTFVVPAAPWLPALSVVINVFLMCKLSIHTWIRFVFWMAAGFLIYGCYGWRNSSEEYKMKGKLPPSQGISDLELVNRKEDNNGNYGL
jgi:amino acid transporter